MKDLFEERGYILFWETLGVTINSDGDYVVINRTEYNDYDELFTVKYNNIPVIQEDLMDAITRMIEHSTGYYKRIRRKQIRKEIDLLEEELGKL